jgi:hypothetical protein
MLSLDSYKRGDVAISTLSGIVMGRNEFTYALGLKSDGQLERRKLPAEKLACLISVEYHHATA